MESIVQQLHEIGSVCFGKFTLKSGIQSPVYIDLRLVMSRSKLLMEIAASIWSRVVASGAKLDLICGVPTGAIPLATCLSVHSGLPMIFWRKEIKDYGRQRLVEGKYEPGQRCLVLEDVFVSGQSTMETVEILRNCGLVVEHVAVFLDRQHGGRAIVESEGLKVHSAISMTKLLEGLHMSCLIDDETQTNCLQFIESTQLRTLPRHVGAAKKPKKLTYKSRADVCKHPLSKKLFEIMAEKETNLAVSADVTKCDELLEIANELGPYMCMIKTHVDILEDYSLGKLLELTKLAEKHNFLIFEDRKFADIGSTVKNQYEGGIYKIAEWSHIINAHSLPGPGIIQGLKTVGQSRGQALVLIAEMSSLDHLCIKPYVQRTVEFANRNKDYVIGFICQSHLTSDPEMLHMVPGVRLEEGTDGLGQSYITPEKAFSVGADLVIVGRGILKSPDRVETAKKYNEICFSEYLKQTVERD
ncbi:orotidine-5'-phosphate decarboxylase [Chamberlinius hualienensis]